MQSWKNKTVLQMDMLMDRKFKYFMVTSPLQLTMDHWISMVHSFRASDPWCRENKLWHYITVSVLSSCVNWISISKKSILKKQLKRLHSRRYSKGPFILLCRIFSADRPTKFDSKVVTQALWPPLEADKLSTQKKSVKQNKRTFNKNERKVFSHF